jgi:hypothetical protein
MLRLRILTARADLLSGVFPRKKIWVWLIGLTAAVLVGLWMSSLAGAETRERRRLVQDWSTRHVLFTGLTAESAALLAERDPRAWHSWLAHGGRRAEASRPEPWWWRLRREPRHSKGLEKDWNMPIGTNVGPNVYAAKFSFDINAAPDCTNDYVVFPTMNSGVPGVGGLNASLVAFNNLYTGPGPTGICPTPLSPSTQPSVLFAYNTATLTGADAYLSPALSLDGTKIAFVESDSGSGNNYAAFHVLTWKAAEGTAWNSGAAPGDCLAGDSCMTTLVLNSVHSDSQSNPFVDYADDTAYVGDDSGQLHKITPVFGGTPAEVTGGGWPVQLHTATLHIFSPVYDSVSGHIFVTDNLGNMYVVNAATGAILSTVSLTAFQPSDVIVDSTNQTVFVFYADLTGHLSVSQFNTSGTLLRKVTAGELSGSDSAYTGAFDNNYYTSPSTGNLYFGGSVNGVASVYSVGFTGTTMNATASGPLVLSTSTTTSTLVPLTEVYNPSFATAQDRLFIGINENCSSANNNGCIESLDITNGLPSGILSSYQLGNNGGNLTLSGIIIDNVSPSAQASSIYFESSPPAGHVSAIKLTQSALQ